MSTQKLVRTYEPVTRVIESWWVDLKNGKHPEQFGSDERTCREYQAKNGGTLQVTRLWETTVGGLYEVTPDE